MWLQAAGVSAASKSVCFHKSPRSINIEGAATFMPSSTCESGTKFAVVPKPDEVLPFILNGFTPFCINKAHQACCRIYGNL